MKTSVMFGHVTNWNHYMAVVWLIIGFPQAQMRKQGKPWKLVRHVPSCDDLESLYSCSLIHDCFPPSSNAETGEAMKICVSCSVVWRIGNELLALGKIVPCWPWPSRSGSALAKWLPSTINLESPYSTTISCARVARRSTRLLWWSKAFHWASVSCHQSRIATA